jgi:hypothetical protein
MTNVTNETEMQASLMAVRIRIDEYEDELIAQLTELRILIRAQDIAKADELVTSMLDILTQEETEDENGN